MNYDIITMKQIIRVYILYLITGAVEPISIMLTVACCQKQDRLLTPFDVEHVHDVEYKLNAVCQHNHAGSQV